MKQELYQAAYACGEKYLKHKAKMNGWKYYSIVEDSFKYENGLLLIGYADEESQKALTDNVHELGTFLINLEDFQFVKRYNKPQRRTDFCKWDYDPFNENWVTSCGTTFTLHDFDRECTVFCASCGKEIKVVGDEESADETQKEDEDLQLRYCYEDLSLAEHRGFMYGYRAAISDMKGQLHFELLESVGTDKEEMEFAVNLVDIVAEQLGNICR